jgi:hypothetical protein
MSTVNYDMILVSCDSRFDKNNLCKLNSEQMRNTNRLSLNKNFHRSRGPNALINFNFWCSSNSPHSIVLPQFKGKFKQIRTCNHNLMV